MQLEEYVGIALALQSVGRLLIICSRLQLTVRFIRHPCPLDILDIQPVWPLGGGNALLYENP